MMAARVDQDELPGFTVTWCGVGGAVKGSSGARRIFAANERDARDRARTLIARDLNVPELYIEVLDVKGRGE